MLMASREASDLRRHSDIEPFLISEAETTDSEVGHGAYGRVVEIKVDGAVCAAKEIHQLLSQQGKSKVTDAFLRECRIMSTLRHPNITQFLGFCFLEENAKHPVLVMERLVTNLHDTLLSQDSPPVRIPLGLKFSILCDVACGLAYLHCRSLIHRDLTATNVLLTTGMRAKITDFGMAREVAITMTECPGNIFYMPPEAIGGSTSYTSAIDIFSWGVLVIFTLTQQLPKPRSATFLSRKELRGRSELERREVYMEKIQLRYNSQGHPARPVISLIKRCLHNDPDQRPETKEVLKQAEKLKENNAEENTTLTKLEFIQRITELKKTINTRENEIARFKEEKEKEIARFKEEKEKEIRRLKQVNESLEEKIKELFPTAERRVQRSYSQREHRSTFPIFSRPRLGSASDAASHKITAPRVRRVPSVRQDTQKASQWTMPLPLKWRQGEGAPFGAVSAQIVSIRQNVYIGGGCTKTKEQERMVQVYNPVEDAWSQLPECPTHLFSLCSDGENLFICCDMDDRLIFSMTEKGIWQHETLPPISEGCMRSSSAFLCYRTYYAIACGLDKENRATKFVEICDTATSKWHTAQPLPVAGHSMCSVMLGDTWYLSGVWEDMKPHIYKVSIMSLIESATKEEVSTESLWEEVLCAPSDRFHLLKFHNALTTVGGKNYSQDIYQFNKDAKAWFKVGVLPVGLDSPIAIELPHSGELLVACGSSKEKPFSENVWIGQVMD